MEHRKLAVDLAEVVIKWELQRTKEDQEQTIEVAGYNMPCRISTRFQYLGSCIHQDLTVKQLMSILR